MLLGTAKDRKKRGPRGVCSCVLRLQAGRYDRGGGVGDGFVVVRLGTGPLAQPSAQERGGCRGKVQGGVEVGGK